MDNQEEITDFEDVDLAAKNGKDVEMLIGMTRHLQQISQSRKKISTASSHEQRNLRDRIQNAKDSRVNRLQSMQMPHRLICDVVALFFNLNPNEVVESVIDSDSSLACLENLLAENGGFAIIFHYQDGPPYEVDSGRFNPAVPKNSTIKRIYVSDGTSIPLTERALVIYRNSNTKDIDLRNLSDDLHFLLLNVQQMNGNIVAVLSDTLLNLVLPSIRITKEWGDMYKTAAGLQSKKTFCDELLSFSKLMEKSKIDLDEIIIFPVNKDVYEKICIPEQHKSIARNVEIAHQVETTVRVWEKQIERVLTQFQQLRRENEFVGPLVEIDYWRRQLTRFSSIVEFYDKDECRMHIDFLVQVQSKLLKAWRKHELAVTNARNKCQDNLKYLYSLKRYCEPLYRCDPSEIPNYLPSLLYALRMVYTTSRYYNNTESVTAILVKISNQMINMCRSYINCDGAKTVWTQPRELVLNKISVCLDLYLKYYQCFKQTVHYMEEAGEPLFDCSEMYVFGKFETFKKRVEKIVDVFNITTKYSILQSSTIEGIDEYAEKFIEFYKKISSQKYDALNHRQEMFNKDYVDFKQNVADTEWELEEFVGNSLERMTNVDNVLRLLKRFEKLDLECLHLNERYLEALEMFQDEIEELRDQYNEHRQDPMLPRNTTPFAGRIMWIRQLYARIEEPMNVFNNKIRVIRHRKAQKCIQLYNSLSCVFVHYEHVYHDAWFKHVGQVKQVLSTPLLLKNVSTRRYIVNFDFYIIETIRETEYIYKLDLPVPESAQILLFCKDKILNSYEVMKQLVDSNDTIRKNIPKLFIPLMKFELLRIENVFMPALSSITWTSMLIPQLCDDISNVLESVQLFVKEVTDLKEARIDEVMDNIAITSLVYLPNKPLVPSEFLEKSKKCIADMLKDINLKLYTAENAVIELINKFMDTITIPELQEGKYNWLDPEKAVKPVSSSSKLYMGDDAVFREVDRSLPVDLSGIHVDCIEMFSYFNSKVIECLVKATKLSLDNLKSRATATR